MSISSTTKAAAELSPPRRPCHAAAALVLLLLGSPLPAAAESQQDQARLLFREGNELFRRGSYPAALAKYRRAKALYPTYKIDMNIGTTLKVLGRLTEAAEHYDTFLRRAIREAPLEDLVRGVTGSLQELRAKLARVNIVCVVAGSTVKLDGKRAGTTPLGHELYMLPGKHRLAVHKKGYQTHQQELVVAAGSRRQVEVPWTASSEMEETRVTAVPPRAEGPAPDLAAKRRRKSIWGYSALVAAGACAVGAVVLYGVGAGQASSAYDKYNAAKVPEEIEQHRNDVESAGTLFIPGHVLVGLGAVALGISIYHLVTRPSTSETRAGVRSEVGLSLVANGARAAVSGEF